MRGFSGLFTEFTPSADLLKRLGNNLSFRYVVPPFSVLDARQGYWQERKRTWISLGIQSELGRGEDLVSGDGRCCYNGRLEWSGNRGGKVSPGGSPRPATRLGSDGKTVRGDGKGKPLARTFGSGDPGDLAASFKSRKKKKASASPYGVYDGDGVKQDDCSCRNAAATPKRRVPSSIPGGGTGKNSAWLFRTPSGYEATQKKTYKQGRIEGAIGSPNEETTAAQGSGTSIFDPVLTEISYKWFCPPGGRILDPFAGGSVRGIVASVLGYHYTGIDLSGRQLEANCAQAEMIVPGNPPTWIEGDSRKVKDLAEGKFDMIFSCPPYFSLELYSYDKRDLSNMTTEGFLAAYRKIIHRSLELLKPNRFAVFVVGNTREGHYYSHLPTRTTQIFEEAGAMLYNESVLVTAVGSLPLRVKRQFESARKIGRTHQNVLVFCKGDCKKAAQICGGKSKKKA